MLLPPKGYGKKKAPGHEFDDLDKDEDTFVPWAYRTYGKYPDNMTLEEQERASKAFVEYRNAKYASSHPVKSSEDDEDIGFGDWMYQRYGIYPDDLSDDDFDSAWQSFQAWQKSRKPIESASYGGAYDIEDDMFFTKDDIVEFGYEIAEDFSIWAKDHYELSDAYMENPKSLHLEISNDDIVLTSDVGIDMRKIRLPRDIFKYKDAVMFDLKSAYEEYMGGNEGYEQLVDVDSATNSCNVAASRWDGKMEYYRVEYFNKDGRRRTDELHAWDENEAYLQFMEDHDDVDHVDVIYRDTGDSWDPVYSSKDAKNEVTAAKDPEPPIEPHEEEDAEAPDVDERIKIKMDAIVDVDQDGYWIEDDESDISWAEGDEKDGSWSSSEYPEFTVTSQDNLVEDAFQVVDTHIPGAPGRYRIQCDVMLVYEISGVTYDVDSGEHYFDRAEVDLLPKKCEVKNFIFKKM